MHPFFRVERLESRIVKYPMKEPLLPRRAVLLQGEPEIRLPLQFSRSRRNRQDTN
jgi:hypothetical protein